MVLVGQEGSWGLVRAFWQGVMSCRGPRLFPTHLLHARGQSWGTAWGLRCLAPFRGDQGGGKVWGQVGTLLVRGQVRDQGTDLGSLPSGARLRNPFPRPLNVILRCYNF